MDFLEGGDNSKAWNYQPLVLSHLMARSRQLFPCFCWMPWSKKSACYPLALLVCLIFTHFSRDETRKLTGANLFSFLASMAKGALVTT